MPIYVYECTTCKQVKEVIHSMSEMTDPKPQTAAEITCHGIMKRIPALPYLPGMVGGVSVGNSGVAKEYQKDRKKRSAKHFRDDVMPTINKKDRAYFEKKHKKKT